MIEWDKYFDHIFCIHYLSDDRIKRHNLLIEELDRVGILNSKIFSFIYDTNNPINNILYDNHELLNKFSCLNYEHNAKYAFRVTVNHLQSLYISKYLKYNKILILEDDICFLKDLNKIKEILENNIDTLNIYELCLYDYIKYDANYVYADCYALNNIGINKLIDNIVNNDKIYTIDNYFNLYNHINFFAGEDNIDIIIPKLLNITTCGDLRLGIQRNNLCYNEDIDYNLY